MKKFYLSVILTLIAVGFGVLLVFPTYQNWKSLKSQIKMSEAELESKKEYFSEVEKAHQKITENQEALDEISKALPDPQSVPALFDHIHEMAKETGMLLEGISLESVKAVTDSAQSANQEEQKQSSGRLEGGVKETSMGLEAKGSYSSLKNFLAAASKSFRMIEVSKISFEKPEEGEESFSFQIKLKTYSY